MIKIRHQTPYFSHTQILLIFSHLIVYCSVYGWIFVENIFVVPFWHRLRPNKVQPSNNIPFKYILAQVVGVAVSCHSFGWLVTTIVATISNIILFLFSHIYCYNKAGFIKKLLWFFDMTSKYLNHIGSLFESLDKIPTFHFLFWI